MILALLVALQLGQVAGLCGPGKACAVKSLTALSGVKTGLVNGSIPACSSSTEGTLIYDLTTHQQRWCDSGNWSVVVGAPASTYPVAWSYGFRAALAYASFPACDGTKDGALIWDTTNSVLRVCNNSAGLWQGVGQYGGVLKQHQVVFFPGDAAVNAPLAEIGHWIPYQSATNLTYALKSAATVVAGTGAGNVTFAIYHQQSSTTVTSITVPCAAAQGTLTQSGTSAAPPLNVSQPVDVRMTANGCATLPQLNLLVEKSALAP